MQHKSIILVSVIALFAVIACVGVVIYERSKPAKPALDIASHITEQPKQTCPEIPKEELSVIASLIRGTTVKDETQFRLVLDSTYPVNVAKMVLTYDPKSLRFVSVDYAKSVFPVEAPGTVMEGVLTLSRAITGKGEGLVGSGEFGAVTFRDIRSSKKVIAPLPVIDVNASVVYLNDGCATKAELRTQNQES